jgi:outer membrane protein assembly factor BamB
LDKYIISSLLELYDFNGNLIYSHQDSDLYDYEKINFEFKTLWKKVDETKNEVLYYIFDIQKQDFVRKDIMVQNAPVFLLKDRLITRGVKELKCYETDSFSETWQFDITQFGTYKENKIFADREPEERQREIYRVYYHQDKIIASISRAVIALNPQNGELIWKIDFEGHEPIDLIFDKDVCYGGQWRFTIIDIRNGVKILESDYDRDIEIEGNKISRVSSGSGLVLYNKFLWCTFSEHKNRFLAKLNPENGKIIDAMKLDTTASTRPPVFDENRVYILDQDGELFIYEEQI